MMKNYITLQYIMNDNILIENVVFCLFDTETTGNNKFNDDKAIELAYLNFSLNSEYCTEVKSFLINPEKLIHPSASAVHGLVDEDVYNAPKLNEILPIFLTDLKNNTLVAHNIEFDLKMLPEVNSLNNKKIDSLKLAKKIYKIGDISNKGLDLRSHKMQELRYWLGLNVDTFNQQSHRAAADVLVMKEVFKILLEKAIMKFNLKTLKDLEDFINEPNIVEKFNFGKFNDRKISDVILEEFKNSPYKNYFHWLFREIHSGKMKIDPDLQYSIETELLQKGIKIEKLIG